MPIDSSMQSQCGVHECPPYQLNCGTLLDLENVPWRLHMGSISAFHAASINYLKSISSQFWLHTYGAANCFFIEQSLKTASYQ